MTHIEYMSLPRHTYENYGVGGCEEGIELNMCLKATVGKLERVRKVKIK